MRILVAEDATNIRIGLKRMLTRCNHEVVTASDGAQAWKLLQEDDIRLVISDWMMPKMDGIELCRNIREKSSEHYTYVILLTAKDEKADLIKGMAAGADDFMVKPFVQAELEARVRAAERVLDLQRELAARNERLAKAYARIQEDLLAAAAMQKSLLPSGAVEFGNARFDWAFCPSAMVSGDIFNYFPLDDRRVAFYSLDVAGHGVSSAMLSVALSQVLTPEALNGKGELATVRTVGGLAPDPAELVESLNKRFLCADNSALYFTMFLGFLDRHTGELTYCQAGHPNAILIARDDSPEYIGDGGFPVGLLPNVAFEIRSLTLCPGDRLFVYTDGVTDCCCPKGQPFGEDRLLAFLGDHSDDTVKETLESVERRLFAWKGDSEWSDDVSILAIEFSRNSQILAESLGRSDDPC